MADNGASVLVDSRGRSLRLTGEMLVAGRAAESNIVLPDERASRRQFMLRRLPAGWAVRDLDSTNGTYVNGRRLRPGEEQVLTPGDRLTIGDLSFTVQVAPVPGPSVNAPPNLPMASPPGRAVAQQKLAAATTSPAWQWVVAALVMAGAALVGIGASQPWVRIDLQFTLGQAPGGQMLEDLLSIVEQAAGALLGTQPLIRSRSIVLGGMETYGALALIAGAVALIGLLVDFGLKLARSVVPGLIYLLAGLIPMVLVYVEIQRFSALANQEILFGVNLLKMLEGATKLLAPKLTLLTGLYLTGIGLGVLLIAGILRCLMPLLTRKDRM